MCPVALLPHVLVHVPEPVDPALELDEVGGVRLHCEVHRGLGLVDHDGEPDGDGESEHDDDLSVKHQATCISPERGYHREHAPRTASD